jgi:magnesium-transporting ATPase (P-type)
MSLDKVQRLFVYTLSSSTPQLAAVVLTVVLGIPLPLPAIMMVWIGLVVNTLLGSTLVDLRPESNPLCTPMVGDEIATGRAFRFAYCQIGLIQTFAAVGGYLLVFTHHGISLSDLRGTVSQYTDQNFKHVCGLDYDSRLELLASAQTAYLITLTVMQLANSVGCRTKICAGPTSLIALDKSIILGLFKVFSVTLLVVYLPIFQGIVGTRSAGLSVWFYSAMCALFALILDEIRKYALRKERSQPDSAQALGPIERWATY